MNPKLQDRLDRAADWIRDWREHKTALHSSLAAAAFLLLMLIWLLLLTYVPALTLWWQ